MTLGFLITLVAIFVASTIGVVIYAFVKDNPKMKYPYVYSVSWVTILLALYVIALYVLRRLEIIG